jgi:uncharacterized protein
MRNAETVKASAYMNPYLAGFLLGLILLATIYITGRGLGASGAFKSVAIASVETVAPGSCSQYGIYTNFAAENPGRTVEEFFVFEVLGVSGWCLFLGGTGQPHRLKT